MSGMVANEMRLVATCANSVKKAFRATSDRVFILRLAVYTARLPARRKTRRLRPALEALEGGQGHPGRGPEGRPDQILPAQRAPQGREAFAMVVPERPVASGKDAGPEKARIGPPFERPLPVEFSLGED